MSRGFELISEGKKKNDFEITKLPRRGTSRSAGYDFYTEKTFTIPSKGTYMYWTDIKAFMKNDEVLLIDVRSSVHDGLRLNNTVGIIDSDYYNNIKNEGNIGIKFYNDTDNDITFNSGDKIAQGIFTYYLITDNDCPVSEDRIGGFGSTNKQ